MIIVKLAKNYWLDWFDLSVSSLGEESKQI